MQTMLSRWETGWTQVADETIGADTFRVYTQGAATLKVASENEAPTATNLAAAETYTEDTPLNLKDIVVSDADGDPVNVTLTLSNTAAGSLNTGTSNAVTSTYVAGSSGNNSHTVTVPRSAFTGRVIVNSLGGNDTIGSELLDVL